MEIRMDKITLISFIAPFMALVFSPLLFGIINRTKAIFGGRKGQSLLQMYYDIFKLMRKGAVYSTTTTWIFWAGPLTGFAALIVAVCIMPFGRIGAPLSFTGDILLLMYLLGLARFLAIIAALDTGSAFEGMGASREAFFAVLTEPVLLLGIFTVAKDTHLFSCMQLFNGAVTFNAISALLVAISVCIILLAENARIPFDDPNTHLELTMIHEVMILDHSGPDFAFIQYAAALKLWLFALLAVRIVVPYHPESYLVDGIVTLGCLVFLYIGVGIVESVMARLQLIRIPQLILGAFALAVLGFLFGNSIAL